MDPYNKAKLLAGRHADTELGLRLFQFPEERRKFVLELVQGLLVQVLSIAPEGNCVGSFNGLFYLGGYQEPLILTVAHCIGWAGATSYRAAVSLDPPSTSLQLDVVKLGNRLSDASPPTGAEYNPDVVVFRVLGLPDESFDLPPPLLPKLPSLGDTVYVVAIVDGDDSGARTASLSEGVVSTFTLDKCTTTAYADNGSSGAPVVSADGFLVGLVFSVMHVGRHDSSMVAVLVS